MSKYPLLGKNCSYPWKRYLSFFVHLWFLIIFQGKRNRENDRISHLEENNRLNQRIDQLEGRNQQLQDKVTKSK